MQQRAALADRGGVLPVGRSSDRRGLTLVMVGVGLLALLAHLLPGPRTIDDAFITFRYSRNLVEGHGFVYNPGVRTLGTTTPLYTLLMAALGWITGSGAYPWFAVVVNALAAALTALLLAGLMYRLAGHLLPAALVGVLWAISPMSVTFAVGGMETSVAILWMAAATWAYVTGRERWMACFAALGVLTRIDTLIWVGLLFAHQLCEAWRGRRRSGRGKWPWQGWLIFSAVIAPWFLFSLVYFGAALPRSLDAKRLAYVVESTQAVVRLLQHYATPFFEYDALGVPGIIVGLVLYPALAAAGTLYASRRCPRLLPFLLYPWVYLLVFSLSNPLIFRWYLAPPLPAYFVAIVMGVWALAQAVAEAVHRPRLPTIAGGTMGAVFVLFSLNAWVLRPDHGPNRPAPAMAWHEIELNYRRMAETLRTEFGVTGQSLVAAGDIGAVGYYSRARILDTVGLITPEVSAYYPLDRSLLVDGANYAIPPALVLDYRPEYLVVMESSVRNGLARDPTFVDLYEPVRFIPTDYYGTGMILYQRRDLAQARPAPQTTDQVAETAR
jgi:hypothetical protein